MSPIIINRCLVVSTVNVYTSAKVLMLVKPFDCSQLLRLWVRVDAAMVLTDDDAFVTGERVEAACV